MIPERWISSWAISSFSRISRISSWIGWIGISNIGNTHRNFKDSLKKFLKERSIPGDCKDWALRQSRHWMFGIGDMRMNMNWTSGVVACLVDVHDAYKVHRWSGISGGKRMPLSSFLLLSRSPFYTIRVVSRCGPLAEYAHGLYRSLASCVIIHHYEAGQRWGIASVGIRRAV